MRQLFIIFVILLLPVFISPVEAGENGGFGGIRWGAKITDPGGEQFVEIPSFKGIAPDIKSYQRKGDLLTLAGADLDRINYNFRNGRLVSVNIDFRGFSAYESLLAYCQQQFGASVGSVPKNMEYVTSFENTDSGALLYLQISSPQFSFGRLFIYSADFFQKK